MERQQARAIYSPEFVFKAVLLCGLCDFSGVLVSPGRRHCLPDESQGTSDAIAQQKPQITFKTVRRLAAAVLWKVCTDT